MMLVKEQSRFDVKGIYSPRRPKINGINCMLNVYIIIVLN